MPSEEYQIAKKERDRKDVIRSIVIFSLMGIALVAGLVYIVVTR